VVGVAAGRAIKMCIITVVFANMFLTLAIWGGILIAVAAVPHLGGKALR